MWSVPEGREVRRAQHEEGGSGLFMRGKGFFTSTTVGAKEVVRWWPLPEGESRLIGTVETAKPPPTRSTPPAPATPTRSAGRHIMRSLNRWDLPPCSSAKSGRRLGSCVPPRRAERRGG